MYLQCPASCISSHPRNKQRIGESVTTMTLRKTIFRILLGMFLVLAGIAHLIIPAEFLAQVPPWLPLDSTFVVIASGIVEIILGLALVFLTKYRIPVGWIVAAFFVVIFPGNLSQYMYQVDAFGLTTDGARFTRLFFQPVLIIWALWTTDAWTAWKNTKKIN